MWPTLFFILLMLWLPAASDAGAVMYSFVDQDGRLHFTNVPADPRYKEVRSFASRRPASAPEGYSRIILAAAERYKLDPELIKAIIRVESSYNPGAVSGKGAMGLMQLMPGTAADMNVRAPFEAEENIMGGSRYLRQLLDLFEGDLRLGLAAYNAGPARVLEKRAVPQIPETEAYVERVLLEYGRSRGNIMAAE